jgi:hypothetical protein
VEENSEVPGDDAIQKFIEAACDDGWDPAEDGWDLLEFDDSESTPPLEPSELKSIHECLATWRSPADFRVAVGDLHKRCRSSEIFKNPRLNFLLDAWTLAEFVRHKPVDRVRLAGPSESWPDGQVRIGQETKNVEITAALTAGRKMGDEYKPGPTKFTFDPVENWSARADGIRAALEATIENKLAKRYSSPYWLVVYLNINDGGIRQRETEQAIDAIKQRHAQAFGGLFVIWKDKLL